MLRLFRDITQTIMIGDDIQVKILGIEGTTVHVGIKAPKTIPVHRREVYEHIKREVAQLKR